MECASIFGLLSLSKVSYVFGACRNVGKRGLNIFAHRVEDYSRQECKKTLSSKKTAENIVFNIINLYFYAY